jgi:hypothetical protein
MKTICNLSIIFFLLFAVNPLFSQTTTYVNYTPHLNRASPAANTSEEVEEPEDRETYTNYRE